jgi:iron complex transport system permease protein
MNHSISVGQARSAAWWRVSRLSGVVLISALLVTVAGVIQMAAGVYPMGIASVLGAIFDPEVWGEPASLYALTFGGEVGHLSTETLIVWSGRLPRVIVGLLVGTNLAISGAIFQAITRNDLASPYILGVSGGAGLAVLLVLVVAGQLVAYLPLFAAIGGALAFVLVYAIAWKGGTSPLRLVLAGVIVGTFYTSLQTSVFYMADRLAVLKNALSWTTGSLMGTGWSDVRMILPWTMLTLVLTLIGTRQLNVLQLGERTARSLGMSVERTRFGLSAVAILAAATAIAASGLIGFVGLIVPHIVRNVVGSDYRRLIIGCIAVGPALLVCSDVLARLALSPMQVPVGIVTGILGAPYFLYLMRRRADIGGA